MKLIEISILVILLPLFAVNLSTQFLLIGKMQKEYAQKTESFFRDKVIVNGFKNLCEKKGIQEEDFTEFSDTCLHLFSLDSIQITVLGIKDNKKCVRCTWKIGETEEKVISVLSCSP